MGRALQQRLQQTRPMAGPVQEVAVNLLLAASWLTDRVERALAPVGITHTQFNVLRILRGAHPGGHPRCEIARRMIDRAPDVTRLIDRLEARGLAERGTDPEDARRSVTRITRSGLALLARANEAVAAVEEEIEVRLSPRQIDEASLACEALYGPDTE